MENKLKRFLNSLTSDEVVGFWRFLRTKKWQEWLNTRMNGRMIDA